MTGDLFELSAADTEAAAATANEMYAALNSRGLVRRDQQMTVLRMMLGAAIVDTALAVSNEARLSSEASVIALLSPSEVAKQLLRDTKAVLARHVAEILEHQGGIQ